MTRSRVAPARRRPARRRKMEFIPGAELTAEHEDTEVHILGYFLDTQNQVLLGRIAEIPVRPAEPHPRNGRRAEPARHSAPGRNGFCAGQLQVARTPARRPRAGEGKTHRQPRRSVRAVSQKRPARVGAQDQNVRARSRRVDSSGRRTRGDGASGLEPHGRNHSRHSWTPGWTASNVFTRNIPPRWPSVIWKSPRNIICWSPAAATATVSAKRQTAHRHGETALRTRRKA